MTLYGRLKRMKLDLAAVGFEQRSERGGYFCTPVGARVVGWAGVDGIHYCTVKGHGERIFAVMPMNEPGKYVLPIAEGFEDLLRLLLAVYDLSLAETALFCAREVFEEQLGNTAPTDEQRQVLERIAEKFSLSPLEDPYGYIRDLSDGFEPESIKFGPDYWEWVPRELQRPKEWKVYWQRGFWPERGKGRPGKEVAVNRSFSADGETWYVPSMYVCSAGLVLDILKEVSAGRVRAFWEKWRNCDESSFSEEQREAIEAESPLDRNFSARMTVNGRTLSESYSYGETWIPEGLTESDAAADHEAKWTLERYGLDSSKCWIIRRIGLPWVTAKKPELTSAELELSFDAVSRTGTHFSVSEVGERVSVFDPFTGAEHTLTVVELERANLPDSAFADETQEFPTSYTAISYTLSPELGEREFCLRDCREGDRPRMKRPPLPTEPAAVGDAVIGIIGGADGPTALIFGRRGEESRIHAAVSALLFEPAERVEWRAVFSRKMKEDIRFSLL